MDKFVVGRTYILEEAGSSYLLYVECERNSSDIFYTFRWLGSNVLQVLNQDDFDSGNFTVVSCLGTHV